MRRVYVYLCSLCKYTYLRNNSQEEKKSKFALWDPCSFEITHHVFDRFPSPTGHGAHAAHKRSYRPATQVRKRKLSKRELCGFCFDERVELVVAEVWGRC